MIKSGRVKENTLKQPCFIESSMKKITPITLFLAIFFCVPAAFFAQSPYHCTWEKDSYILGAGGITASAGFFLDRSVSSLTTTEIHQLSSETVNWFDRSATHYYSESAATASDVLFGVAAAAPFIMFADHTMRNDWRTITLMYLETWSFIGGSTFIAKGSIERIRPFVYNPDVPMDKKLISDARKSFFSGHTTVAFASAIFLSTVYSDYHPDSKWKPYIWVGSLLTASVVGYLRYDAGMHFPTDNLVSAIVGSAIGYAIPWMHRTDKENISVIPGIPQTDYGFSMQIKF
jgi:membrane-associated phospholipid phosphatase